jgi:hypothetical protein
MVAEPQRISIAAHHTACNPLPQRRLTVYAGVDAGIPAESATRRAL